MIDWLLKQCLNAAILVNLKSLEEVLFFSKLDGRMIYEFFGVFFSGKSGNIIKGGGSFESRATNSFSSLCSWRSF